MRYFCPKCWSDFAEDVVRCPRCGQDIAAFWSGKDYVEKLIAAMDHPEPETPIRAAWILGTLRAMRGVGPLIALIQRTRDVYVARAAVEALGRIGTPEAMQFLAGLSDHPARMVREAAQSILAFARADRLEEPAARGKACEVKGCKQANTGG